MLILGIETSTARSSVCLGTQDGLLAAAALGRGQAHGEFVAPAIRFCLGHAAADVKEVTGVAVSLGPGLYTGMRVGIATAQALAHARGLPVVGLSTLDLLAFPFRYVRSDRVVCAVLDARRGEVFWALYRPSQGGVQRVTEVYVGPPAKLAGDLEALAEDVLCVGDGAAAHRGVLASTGAEVASAWTGNPTAEALVELAVPRFLREDTQRPEDLHPVYVRQADARINWEQRGALFGGTAPGAPGGT